MTAILPHERLFLEQSVNQTADILKEASASQGEEAGLGSDWHDNAAYDDARDRTALARGNHTTHKNMLENAEVVDYPDPASTEVQLGSLVFAKDRFGDTPFILVGQRLAGMSTYENAWKRAALSDEDLNVITMDSALGSAALGAVAGDIVEYEITNDKKHAVTIVEVNQSWLHENFAE